MQGSFDINNSLDATHIGETINQFMEGLLK
jgi:hypothetical protein